MSNSCQASNPYTIPSVAAPSNSLGLRLLPTTGRRDDKSQDEDRAKLRPLQCAGYFAVKPLIDRLITLMLMVVALPIMIVVGLAIAVIDGRPVFYRQTRVGKNGRIFRIWKFRTMCQDAENGTGAVWSSEGDPRVTPLGRWLRCSHLDELPQFFNVLLGDMNLIGPRPERPEFVRELLVELPRYAERLAVRPGITGLAQLRFGYDQSLADVRRKALLDSKYVRMASIVLDVTILLGTIPYVARQVIRKCSNGSDAACSAGRLNVVAPPVRIHSEDKRSTQADTAHGVTPHIPLLPKPTVDRFASSVRAAAPPCPVTIENTLGMVDEPS